ncbi:MAG: hypothetical protein LBT37_07525 [Lactobacillaceae bacterium]|jgi:hypothetical protein|nr:hypothetical protein [Lactobacillaceae bacterium]
MKQIKWFLGLLVVFVAIGIGQNVSADVRIEQKSFQLLTPKSITPKYKLELHIAGGKFATSLPSKSNDIGFGKNFKNIIATTIKLDNDDQDVTIDFTVTPDQNVDRANTGTVTIPGEDIKITSTSIDIAKNAEEINAKIAELDNAMVRAINLHNYDEYRRLSDEINGLIAQRDRPKTVVTDGENVKLTLTDEYVPGVVYQKNSSGSTIPMANQITWNKDGLAIGKDAASTGFLALADSVKEGWKASGTVKGAAVGCAKLLILGGAFGDTLELIVKAIQGSKPDAYMQQFAEIKTQISRLSQDIRDGFDRGAFDSARYSYKKLLDDFTQNANSELSNINNNVPIGELMTQIKDTGIFNQGWWYHELSTNQKKDLRDAARGVFATSGEDLSGAKHDKNFSVLAAFEKFDKYVNGDMNSENLDIFKLYATYSSLKYNYNSSTFADRQNFNHDVKNMYLYYYLPIVFAVNYDQWDNAEQLISLNDEVAKINDVLTNPKNERYDNLTEDDRKNLKKALNELEEKRSGFTKNIAFDKKILGDYDGATANGVSSVTSSNGPGAIIDLLKSKKQFAKHYGSEEEDPNIDLKYDCGHANLNAEMINFDKGCVYAYRIQKYIDRSPLSRPNWSFAFDACANTKMDGEWLWMMKGNFDKWYAKGSGCRTSEENYQAIRNALSREEIKRLINTSKVDKNIYSELAHAGITGDGLLYGGQVENASKEGGFAKAPTFTAYIYLVNAQGHDIDKVKAFNEDWCWNNVRDPIQKYYNEENSFMLRPTSLKKAGCVDYTPIYNY